jgi:hypothetical protein
VLWPVLENVQWLKLFQDAREVDFYAEFACEILVMTISLVGD